MSNFVGACLGDEPEKPDVPNLPKASQYTEKVLFSLLRKEHCQKRDHMSVKGTVRKMWKILKSSMPSRGCRKRMCYAVDSATVHIGDRISDTSGNLGYSVQNKARNLSKKLAKSVSKVNLSYLHF